MIDDRRKKAEAAFAAYQDWKSEQVKCAGGFEDEMV